MNLAKQHSQSTAATLATPARGWLARDWLVGLLLFVAALVPRALATGGIVTVDEAYHWFDRVAVFLAAVQRGDFAATNIIGHPGVTTMWLGALGVLLRDALIGMGVAVPEGAALDRALLRLLVALVTALCVAVAYPLLRRLLGRRVALLAALFLAFDPFLVAHSQLLHLDALLTSFMLLALLFGLHAIDDGRWTMDDSQRTENQKSRSKKQVSEHHHVIVSSRHLVTNWRLWFVSGVCGGLALLTKSPAIALVPMIGFITLYALRFTLYDSSSIVHRLSSIVKASVLPLLAWVAVAVGTWFVLWPAAWVDPLGAAERMLLQAEADGGSPHGWGNFFLGQPVDDPGILFYPVALVLRLTPWALLGLLLLPLAWWLGRTKDERRRTNDEERRMLVILAVFVLGFLAMMSVPPKKFDRYILPIFPAINILAAMGIVGMYDVIKHQASSIKHRFSFVIYALFFVLLSANLAWYHPYELAYYNPLLGGGATAVRAIPVGWGEGYEQAAAYVNAQPNGRDRPVAAWFEPVLRRNLDTDVVPLAWIDKPGGVDYAMLYVDQIQRDDVPEAITQLGQRAPIHTVRIHGIEYAYIYQLPQPVATARPADFGDAIHLRGYDLDTTALRASGVLTLTLHWQARAPISTDYTMFIHVLDERGERIGQADLPPGSPRAPTSAWQPSHYVDAVQTVPVQADALSDHFWIAIGLYDPQSFARLPLRAPAAPDAPDDGGDALLLGPFGP